MNTQVHYEVVGEDRPVLVLHGGYLDHRHMVDALEPIFEHRQGWKRVYIDIPGHGQSKADVSIDTHEQVLDIILDFMDGFAPGERFAMVGESLVALVPKPRVNLTRYHGVFAPNSNLRARVTPAKRGKGNQTKAPDEVQGQTPAECRAAMTWAQRLRRVFNIDIETCSKCGGTVKVIACIEDPRIIDKILSHLNEKALPVKAPPLPKSRAPPQVVLFD